MKQKNIFLLFVILIVFFSLARPSGAASGITANVSALNFGDQAEGTISDPQEITLTKSASGDGVIGAIVLAGQDPAQFVILEDFCSGTVLADLEFCTLSVVYGPTVEFPHGVGPAQADLQINFLNPPAISIPLDGNSLVPNIESSVTALDFGKKVAGQLSKPQTVIITNTGDADLVIGGANTSGGDTVDFGPSLDQCSFQTLAPGESCTVELNMRATEEGDRVAQFTIESNDPDQPLFSIDLTGVGTGSGGCRLNSWETPGGAMGIWIFFLVLPLLRLGKKSR